MRVHPLSLVALALSACATGPIGPAVAPEDLCAQIVPIVCGADHTCCAHASSTASDTCATTQQAACDRTLGARTRDARLGYVPERGGALIADLRARAAQCWAEPFDLDEIDALFAGTAQNGERCLGRDASPSLDALHTAAWSCTDGRACRLYLDADSLPAAICEGRSVAGDTRCSHPYDCAPGHWCDAPSWTLGDWGECQPMRGEGWDCTADVQCESGYCGDDGFCGARPSLLRCLEVHYDQLVLAAAPLLYLRLGEPSGTSAHDGSTSALTATYAGTVVHADTGALADDDDGSLSLAGAGNVEIASTTPLDGRTTTTVELWVSVPAMMGGGPVFELARAPTTMTPPATDATALRIAITSGHVAATLVAMDGTSVELASADGSIDTHFHHVALTIAPSGATLYVDGARAAGVTSAHTLPTHAVLELGMHDAMPTTGRTYFTGSIDEVAIYDQALSPTTIASHARAGTEGHLDETPAFFSWAE